MIWMKKKLTNLSPAVYQLANTASLKAIKTQLNNYLKLDGSSVVKGHLQMDFNRIEDVANPRENRADAVPYVYLNNFYFKYDENNCKIDFQSPIDMQNKRITNIQDPRHNEKDSMSYDFFTRRYFKPGQNNDIDCNGKRLYNTGSYTNNDQLITGNITNQRYIQKDQSTVDINNKRVVNALTPTQDSDLSIKNTLMMKYKSILNVNRKVMIVCFLMAQMQ